MKTTTQPAVPATAAARIAYALAARAAYVKAAPLYAVRARRALLA